jgi:DNA-binding transcriptional LysR family regulator
MEMNSLFSLEKQSNMDLHDLRVFCRVAELSSFTKASEQLNMAKGRVSTLIQALEIEVGSRLLQRTTRSVRLTPDGEVFLNRCKELLAEADHLHGMFRPVSADLSGTVRIDMPGLFAQEVVLPRLPELLAKYPKLHIGVSTNDRRVDMVREGFDCLIRVGPLPDSDLVARPMGQMKMCNLASPAYLKRHGVPRSIEELMNHRMIHYANNLRNEDAAFRYMRGGEVHAMRMSSALAVNGGLFLQAACLEGLGIIQISNPTCKRLIDTGELVEILPEFTAPPLPVSVLLSHRRQVSKRVEMVVNWLVSIQDSHSQNSPWTPSTPDFLS